MTARERATKELRISQLRLKALDVMVEIEDIIKEAHEFKKDYPNTNSIPLIIERLENDFYLRRKELFEGIR